MNHKPLIRAVQDAVEEVQCALEAMGLGTRVERSGASNSSGYVYVFDGNGINLKVRVSNHAALKGALWHRKPDAELIVPGGRVSHVVAEIAAAVRTNSCGEGK